MNFIIKKRKFYYIHIIEKEIIKTILNQKYNKIKIVIELQLVEKNDLYFLFCLIQRRIYRIFIWN